MNIIRVNTDLAPEEQLKSDLNNSIFLAGPCPRENYENDWRKQAFEILERLEFKGNVITPTNPDYMKLREKYGDDASAIQTKWETIAMKKASAIVFWVARDIANGFPAFTTNVEFGDWYNKPGVYCGFPVNAAKNEYLKCRLDAEKIRWWDSLEKMLTFVVRKLQVQTSTTFFTADTHFSQQRTLDLSRRPFKTIEDMDLTMISNWNKTVTMNDVVYHAGDFGDAKTMRDIISCLNFKELNLVLGNYDRRDDALAELNDLVNTLPDRNVYLCQKGITLMHNNRMYHVVHEPDLGTHTPAYPDSVVLFGHIHGRAFAKKNGFDIGTDYHNYTPVPIEKIDWFANAIQYWDNNVHCKEAKI